MGKVIRLAEMHFSTFIFGLFFGFMLLNPLPSSAQKALFEFFKTSEGLAGNNTSTVAQDEQGFLWFINDGRIHRYDGRNF